MTLVIVFSAIGSSLTLIGVTFVFLLGKYVLLRISQCIQFTIQFNLEQNMFESSSPIHGWGALVGEF